MCHSVVVGKEMAQAKIKRIVRIYFDLNCTFISFSSVCVKSIGIFMTNKKIVVVNCIKQIAKNWIASSLN